MGYIFSAGLRAIAIEFNEPDLIRTVMELMEQLRRYLPRYPLG
jgi:hypothetical protein